MNSMGFKALTILVIAVLAGCASSTPDVTGSDQPLAMRQIQTREYDTLDKDGTMRSVVATLQDLGFIITSADAKIGTVTASHVYQKGEYKGYGMRMTVTVREREGDRIAVRANARMGEKVIDRPETYQDFFNALDKSMFLTLQQVD